MPTYAWKKNGTALDPASDSRITLLEDGSLQISKVAVADEGTYDCLITQGVATKPLSIQVTVVRKYLKTTEVLLRKFTLTHVQ